MAKTMDELKRLFDKEIADKSADILALVNQSEIDDDDAYSNWAYETDITNDLLQARVKELFKSKRLTLQSATVTEDDVLAYFSDTWEQNGSEVFIEEYDESGQFILEDDRGFIDGLREFFGPWLAERNKDDIFYGDGKALGGVEEVDTWLLEDGVLDVTETYPTYRNKVHREWHNFRDNFLLDNPDHLNQVIRQVANSGLPEDVADRVADELVLVPSDWSEDDVYDYLADKVFPNQLARDMANEMEAESIIWRTFDSSTYKGELPGFFEVKLGLLGATFDTEEELIEALKDNPDFVHQV